MPLAQTTVKNMPKKNTRVLVLMVMTFLLIFSLLALTLPKGTLAQDGENLPSPTPQDVGDVPYTLTQVGGTEATFSMPAFEQDGISVGEATVTSDYPTGMIFTTTATSTNGDGGVTNATLFIELTSGSRNRVPATFDEGTQLWTAHLWDTGGQPAWSRFNAWWSVVDASGVGIETEPITIDYADPTRQWWRAEGDYIIMYWYDGLAGEPDEIAQAIANSMAASHERRAIGFGGPLSYKPIGVIYASSAELAEIYGSGATNPNLAGFTSSDLGMTVQLVGYYDDDFFERFENCVYLDPREEYTEERITNNTILGTIPHEVTHLYQYDKGVLVGPNWWTEGQAEWFSTAPGVYDTRLRNLATMDTLITIQGDNIGSSSPEADGCYNLAYDVGPSFINWLLATYGGLEAHAEIIANLRRQMTLFEAIEAVVGKPFFELENEWRAYIGYNILSLADVDPAAALQDPIDAAFVVGDVVTLPGTPFQVPLALAPGPNQISDAPCFAGTDVTILRVGSLDGVNYYEVDCTGLTGWMTLGQLQGGG